MNVNDIKKEIIQSLRKYHNGKWVSPITAVHNINDLRAFAMLDELVEEQVIERKYQYHKGYSVPLVRYIDRSWDRPSLTIINGGSK